VTPELLFGNDRNRNGIADDFDGQELNRGWSDYLTVYGRELNLDSTGVIRENLNETEVENLPGIYQRLISKVGQEPADFIPHDRHPTPDDDVALDEFGREHGDE